MSRGEVMGVADFAGVAEADEGGQEFVHGFAAGAFELFGEVGGGGGGCLLREGLADGAGLFG